MICAGKVCLFLDDLTYALFLLLCMYEFIQIYSLSQFYQGSMCCSDCKGTGFRAKWLGEPPVSK